MFRHEGMSPGKGVPMFKNFKYYAAAFMASVFTVSVLAVSARMTAYQETGIGFSDAPVMLMLLLALVVALVPFGPKVSDKARVVVGLAIVASVLAVLFVQEFGIWTLLGLLFVSGIVVFGLRDLFRSTDLPSDEAKRIVAMGVGPRYRSGDHYDEKH